jgi:hypothetical protein
MHVVLSPMCKVRILLMADGMKRIVKTVHTLRYALLLIVTANYLFRLPLQSAFMDVLLEGWYVRFVVMFLFSVVYSFVMLKHNQAVYLV